VEERSFKEYGQHAQEGEAVADAEELNCYVKWFDGSFINAKGREADAEAIWFMGGLVRVSGGFRPGRSYAFVWFVDAADAILEGRNTIWAPYQSIVSGLGWPMLHSLRETLSRRGSSSKSGLLGEGYNDSM
jgi:hypothetical protein